jgi:hypothetical protein
MRKLPPPRREALLKSLDGWHVFDWLPFALPLVVLGALEFASNVPLTISFPMVAVFLGLAAYVSHRCRSQRVRLAGIPLEDGRTPLRIEFAGTLVFSILFACICSDLWAAEQSRHQQLAQALAKEADLARQQSDVERRLAVIKAEAARYAASPRHVVNEESLRKNAEKSDAPPESRRIYLKLPLHGVAYHWKFQEKAALLRGALVLTISDHGTSESFTIFQDGALSDEWEIMDCCHPGADEMYFGFVSKKAIPVSESNHIALKLSVDQDIRGIGADLTGTLRQGEYTSFTQFTIYHLKQVDDQPPMAFLNNDGWNVSWVLEEVSNHGWKLAK